jgi:hypothetical protein
MSVNKPKKGPIVSLVSILSVVVFLYLGFQYGLWHPGWIVFFAAPVTAAILNVMGIEDKAKTTDDTGKE